MIGKGTVTMDEAAIESDPAAKEAMRHSSCGQFTQNTRFGTEVLAPLKPRKQTAFV